jgi:hypothetical protein
LRTGEVRLTCQCEIIAVCCTFERRDRRIAGTRPGCGHGVADLTQKSALKFQSAPVEVAEKEVYFDFRRITKEIDTGMKPS